MKKEITQRKSFAAYVMPWLLLTFLSAVAPAQDGRTINIPLPFATSVIASGDLFGSALPDVVVSVDAGLAVPGNQIAVLVNEGLCNSPSVHLYSVANGYRRICVIDIDGDGDRDVVTQGSGMVSVLLNQGAASLSFVRSDYGFAATAGLHELACGDVDGDGDVDLALGRSVLPNIGAGTFGPEYVLSTPTAAAAGRWEWADYDGDGDLDLAGSTANGSLPQVCLWESNGPGTNLALVSCVNLTSTPQTVVDNRELIPGDFNQDGAMDLMAQYFDTGAGEVLRPILLGGATNPFSAPTVFAPSSTELPTLRRPVGLDLDGDGAGEIVPSMTGFEALFSPTLTETVPLNYSAAGFTPSTEVYDVLIGAFAPADFNGDGFSDFAVAQQFGAPQDSVTIFLGGTDSLFDLSVVGGSSNQVLAGGVSQTGSIVLELRNCFGNAAAGQTLVVRGLPTGVILANPTPLVTDAAGQVTINVAGTVYHDFEFQIFHELSNAVTVNVDSQPSVRISFVDPPNPFLMLNRHETFRVQVVDDLTMQPISGLPVLPTASFAISIVSTTLFTDANGMAETVINPDTTVAGQTLRIQVGSDSVSSVNAEFAIRGLRVFNPTGSGIAILQYTHENVGVPLLVAADVPLPAPGFVTTAFGPIFTSLLNPQPTLATLDGAVNPQIATPLNLPITLPPGIAGLTLVTQAYGIDPNYAFPESVFLSNPVTTTF